MGVFSFFFSVFDRRFLDSLFFFRLLLLGFALWFLLIEVGRENFVEVGRDG